MVQILSQFFFILSLEKREIDFSNLSQIEHPYQEEPLLLVGFYKPFVILDKSIFQIEIDAIIFLWKAIILGKHVILDELFPYQSKVIITSKGEQIRFEIMEALQMLAFPFYPSCLKFSDFHLKNINEYKSGFPFFLGISFNLEGNKVENRISKRMYKLWSDQIR